MRTGLAFARPIPLDAPVTNAVLFWSEVIVISLVFQTTDKTGTETGAYRRADSVRSSALNQVNRSKTESRPTSLALKFGTRIKPMKTAVLVARLSLVGCF